MTNWSPVTLGQQVKSIAVEGFVLTETRHAPSLVIPRHAHRHASISLVLRGSFIETLNRNPQQCLPLNLVIKPAGEIHTNRYGTSGAECLIIEVKPEQLERVRSSSNIMDRALLVRDASLALLGLRVYREFRAMDSASPLAIEGLVLEMLALETRRHLSHSRRAKPRWLLQAVELLREEFAQALSLSKVAEIVGVHPAHLARTFRLAFNCTVGDYLRHLRLECAARELTESDRPLAEIAALAGFYDQSHLTNAFRLHMKTTPAAFRAALKGARNPATKKLRSSKTS